MTKYKRQPPSFRQSNCCVNCRAWQWAACIYYDYNIDDPENKVCDDYRPCC